MEETPPLRPAPYDPERWLRRWTTAAGGLLAATVLIPKYEGWGSTASARRGEWRWPWDSHLPPDALGYWLLTFAPYILGIAAVVGVRRARGKLRALLIGLPAVHMVVMSLYQLVDLSQGGSPFEFLLMLATGLLLLPVAAATAAGVHLARRYPESTVVRRRSRALGVGFAIYVVGSAAASELARWSSSSNTLDWDRLVEALLLAAVAS
jgi:hypothetical protein